MCARKKSSDNAGLGYRRSKRKGGGAGYGGREGGFGISSDRSESRRYRGVIREGNFQKGTRSGDTMRESCRGYDRDAGGSCGVWSTGGGYSGGNNA